MTVEVVTQKVDGKKESLWSLKTFPRLIMKIQST